MSSVPVWHKIKMFVCPSGKRRKGKRTTSQTSAPIIPNRPAYPPKPVRPPLQALHTPASKPRELVASVPTATGRVSITPVEPMHMPTTRVIVRSDNHEMDRTIVAGTSWLPKVLVRPDDVRRLTPVAMPSLGKTEMRITVPAPVSVPVRDAYASPETGTLDTGSRTATVELKRVDVDTQDLIITDEWREMFRTEEAHVCRDCRQWGPGVVAEDGRWICGRCLSAGRY